MRSSAGAVGERVDAFGEEERRRGRAVVAGRARERRADLGLGERVVGRGQEVAEEDAVVEHRLPHLDEVQAVRMRQPTLAAKPQDLTALRRARARQPARAQRHPAAEVLDAAEPRERAGDGGLAEEDERGRPCDADRRERLASPRVELGYASSLSPGRPNQTARTERWPSGIRSTACATARSCATSAPARPPMTTAAPAAIPSTTRTTGALRRPSRAPTRRSG